MLHRKGTASGTEPDVNVPDRFQQVCQGQILIAAFELLVSLKPENERKIFRFHAVVQKSIITDFLEPGWKHMHQKPADKFFVLQRDRPSGFPRFPPPGGKGGLRFCHRKNPAVGECDFMGIPPQIFDGVAKAVKRLFDKRAPVLFV